MANPYAGEVSVVMNGDRHVLKLTLGVLAELEAALDADCLVSMVQRFESGRYRTQDVLLLLRAGLRGGGCDASLEDLVNAEFDGGPLGAARAAAAVLARAFSLPPERSE